MCGRFGLANPQRLKALGILDATLGGSRHPATVSADAAALLDAPRFNVAPSQPVVAARTRVREGTPERRVGVLRWGLIPTWARDPAIGHRLANARAESIEQKPSFRGAWNAGRRCLVYADAFYEWRDAQDPTDDPRNGDAPGEPATARGGRAVGRRAKPAKQPFAIRMADDAPFAFGGLWEAWRDPATARDDPAGWVVTCTLITTAPNALMRPIHDRMPVIVPPAAHAAWLNPTLPLDEARAMLVPYAADAMHAYPVSRAVNDPRHDTPDVLDPLPPAADPPAG